jgi:hypothetical protein
VAAANKVEDTAIVNNHTLIARIDNEQVCQPSHKAAEPKWKPQ